MRFQLPDMKSHHALSLSFKPLLADRIAFRECETFFFGTARRIPGKISSRSEANEGSLNAPGNEKRAGSKGFVKNGILSAGSSILRDCRRAKDAIVEQVE
jgi:hypothetical protein